MTDWTELKDLQAVAKAANAGWEIDVSPNAFQQWRKWGGTVWRSDDLYRGRPKAERKEVVRVREAVLGTKEGDLYQIQTISEATARMSSVFLGWVKGSQWKEVEYD